LAFQDPGLGIPNDPACTRTDVVPPRNVCTDPVRIALDFVGFDNFADPGDVPTESFNPVQSQVRVEHNGMVQSDRVFLLDTGAQLSILSTDEAEAFGLDLDHPQTSVAIQGAGGAVYDVPGFTIDRISVPLIGGATLSFLDVPIYVLDVAPGVIDGVLGMNLFNNAAAMVYDPFDSRGPSLELNFFTEHFEEPDLGSGQFSLLEQLMPGFAATLTGTGLPGFIPRDTVGPHLNLSAPLVTNDPTPVITINGDASDLHDGTNVAVDVDLNDDGDFGDPGERDYMTDQLVGGTAQFELTPGLAEGSYHLMARASDAAGNEGTSSEQTLIVDLTAPNLENMPGDQTIPAVGPTGAIAYYAMPTATDAIDGNPSVTCTPVSGSTFPIGTTVVQCTATDDAGNSRSATFSIEVRQQQTGGFDFTGNVLTITGTDQNDQIELVKAGKGIRVQSNFGSFTIPRSKSLGRVVVSSGGGDDRIDLSILSSKQSSLIDGGDGNDSVIGGAGTDIVMGGFGDDQLNGSDGDNALIGGAGADLLVGGRGSDLLIAGRLNDSSASIDVPALLIAWRRARTASAKLAAIQSLVDSALDDSVRNELTGGKGVDLFVAGPLDQLTDRGPEDIVV
jgi:Ca2+-binding RTX toxin-like protein